jgi:hypothetical protein
MSIALICQRAERISAACMRRSSRIMTCHIRLVLALVVLLLVSCSPNRAGSPDRLVTTARAAANVQYSRITTLPDGGRAQTISFQDASAHLGAFEAAAYPNNGHRLASEWITDKWDRHHLLVLMPCSTSLGDCIVVADSTTFRQQANPTEQDFSELAVIVSGGRALVIDRLNGMQTGDQQILAALGIKTT